MTKLSEAQRRVLEAMADGAVLKIGSLIGLSWLEQLNTGERRGTVDYVTSQDLRLSPLGLVAEVARYPHVHVYAITEAGRATLNATRREGD